MSRHPRSDQIFQAGPFALEGHMFGAKDHTKPTGFHGALM
jgi:hypothetical protein